VVVATLVRFITVRRGGPCVCVREHPHTDRGKDPHGVVPPHGVVIAHEPCVRDQHRRDPQQHAEPDRRRRRDGPLPGRPCAERGAGEGELLAGAGKKLSHSHPFHVITLLLPTLPLTLLTFIVFLVLSGEFHGVPQPWPPVSCVAPAPTARARGSSGAGSHRRRRSERRTLLRVAGPTAAPRSARARAWTPGRW